jgi:hypothetical protein
LLHRVRAEFDELRGLKLTFAQVRRLFGLRDDVCQRVLDTLMREGFLYVGVGELYERRGWEIFRGRAGSASATEHRETRNGANSQQQVLRAPGVSGTVELIGGAVRSSGTPAVESCPLPVGSPVRWTS